jgi:cytochrome c oxidase cbb3-type subunit II
VNRVSVFIFGGAGVLVVTSMVVVVTPYAQLGAIPPESKLPYYTKAQARGRELYVSLGCMYCHSQQPRDRAFAPDESRGWGRAPTPGDYARDYPHQLGTMRTGPDLFNIGARQPSRDWHLTHLYQPRAVVPSSIMPSFPFLFVEKPTAAPSDVVVKGAERWATPGSVVVATQDALDLTDYLRGLDHTYPSDVLPTEARRTASAGNSGTTP